MSMNLTSLQILKTERMQVVYILLAIVLGIILTFNYVWSPLQQKKEELESVRSELERHRFANVSPIEIKALRNAEMKNYVSLSNEWERIRQRMETFPSQILTPGAEMDRIDFKVELYAIRQRLQQKSEELKIQLMPKELGLDETLDEADDPRVRMLQLKAVEKLADLTLDRQIQRLNAIYPLPPIVHYENDSKKDDGKKTPNARNVKEEKPKGKKIFEEYPVRIECDVDFDHLFTFFQSIFEENQVFTFRNIRIESGPTFDSKLRVKAILSALLFN